MSSCSGNCSSCGSSSCGDRKAESLLATLNPKASVKKVIAVVSGKGGTGKTSVCAGLSVALAAQGKRVLSIDCDVGLRNLDISLGLSQMDAVSLLEVCRGEYDICHALPHPDFPELFFLTAPVNCRPSEIRSDAFCAMLRSARRHFDYIFLDAPAGVDAGFQLAARYAERVLLVTGADPASVRDARRAGDLLELMGKTDVRMIVNRVDRAMLSLLRFTIDDVMDSAGLPLLGVVPEDPNVTLAAAFGKPLLKMTKRGAAKACRSIAKRIQGNYVPVKLK